MSINKKDIARDAINQKLYAASKPDNLVPAPTYCNAATTGPYVPPEWNLRGDANDHQQYASRDSGAMIVRV